MQTTIDKAEAGNQNAPLVTRKEPVVAPRVETAETASTKAESSQRPKTLLAINGNGNGTGAGSANRALI